LSTEHYGEQGSVAKVPATGEGATNMVNGKLLPSSVALVFYDLPLRSHGRGRGFEPRRPRHKPKKKNGLWHSDNSSSTFEGAGEGARASGTFLLP
jgi:hypothetical protein